MKTIATFSTPEEAHMLRMRLESAGFEVFVLDEYTIQTFMLSNAFGGVRVAVTDEDLEEIQQFLAADLPVPEEKEDPC